MIKATDSVTRRNIPGVHGMFGMQVETAQTRLFESLLSRKLRFEKKMRKAVVGRAASLPGASQLQIGYSVQLKSNPCDLTGIMILSDR